MVSHFPGSFTKEHYTKSQVLALFAEFLRERRLTEIDARLVREFCKMHGKRLGSRYRSGRSPDWLKFKNPAAPAVLREAEEDWGRRAPQ
jgi:hypothetical protein